MRWVNYSENLKYHLAWILNCFSNIQDFVEVFWIHNVKAMVKDKKINITFTYRWHYNWHKMLSIFIPCILESRGSIHNTSFSWQFTNGLNKLKCCIPLDWKGLPGTFWLVRPFRKLGRKWSVANTVPASPENNDGTIEKKKMSNLAVHLLGLKIGLFCPLIYLKVLQLNSQKMRN